MTEQERREEAQRNRGKVVRGAGEAMEGRRLDQMVSLRLDPDLLAELRSIAERQSMTVSDLLRAAAMSFVESMHGQEAILSGFVIDSGWLGTILDPHNFAVQPLVGFDWSGHLPTKSRVRVVDSTDDVESSAVSRH
jgi:uncharacterized protein (DUF4415 family)